jgi:hypothetical protein
MNITVDRSTTQFVERLNASFGSWDEHLHHNMASHYANSMTEFIKPHVRAKASMSNGGTGESEKSIAADISHSANGFDIAFTGSLGAFYMDEGNFNASAMIARASNKSFPVGLRNNGSITWSKYIHGMGYRTPATPTHYSDLAATAWDTDEFTDIAMHSMENWLNEVTSL